MRVVRTGSAQEKRLIHESKVLSRRLRRMARDIGAEGFARDSDAEKLNHELGCDIVGLIALKVRLGLRAATLLCAPGCYFNEARPDVREQIDRLSRARRVQGRRTVIVPKHAVLGRIPFDLTGAIEGPVGQDRRGLTRLLSATGRRVRGAADPRGADLARGGAPEPVVGTTVAKTAAGVA